MRYTIEIHQDGERIATFGYKGKEKALIKFLRDKRDRDPRRYARAIDENGNFLIIWKGKRVA